MTLGWRRKLVWLALGLPLLAGPPSRTDDPAPVDLGSLELYLFSAGQKSRARARRGQPQLDLRRLAPPAGSGRAPAPRRRSLPHHRRAGGQPRLHRLRHRLLISLGRNVHGETQTFFYVGYQSTTGTFGDLRDWFRHGRG